MQEREKCNKTSHHRPQCAKWFSRYSISKSGIWARWTSPFCRFSASFSLKYDVTDAMLQDNEKIKVQYLRSLLFDSSETLQADGENSSRSSGQRIQRITNFETFQLAVFNRSSYFLGEKKFYHCFLTDKF